VEGAVPMPPRRLLRFRLAVHSPPAADDELDVLGGAGAADREQALLGLRRRDARQCTDLGVRQLAAGEGLRQARQRTKRARHADVLACGARLESDAPRQPVGARPKAVAPAAARVELADEIEQVRGGGVEMSGELSDLVAEVLELRGRTKDWFNDGRDADTRCDAHRRFSLRRLYTAVFEASGSLQGARLRATPDFFDAPLSARVVAPARVASEP